MFKYLQTFYTIYCRHTYAILKLQRDKKKKKN